MYYVGREAFITNMVKQGTFGGRDNREAEKQTNNFSVLWYRFRRINGGTNLKLRTRTVQNVKL